MNLETFREYCLSKKGVTEELPFGPETLVYKVMGKMFALTGLDAEIFSFNLKNTPEKNQELRAEYEVIVPGYHMNKVHWNTVYANHSIKDLLLRELIDESYDLVAKSLTKKIQEELKNLY